MKINLLAIAACAISLFASAGTLEDADDDDQPPLQPAPQSAADVLYGTVSRLPVEPVTIGGTLILRKQRGIVVKEVPYSIELRWGDTPARAKYTLTDTFGRVLKVLTVTRADDGKITMSSADANGATNAPPALSDAIEGTDITWLDLTLSYLWWKDGELAGEEDFRGALCDIVIVRPPEPIPGCSAMRLWVDRKRGFLRQAEQLNEKGERVRWMWVASIGKINDRWMIRNMEVKQPATGLMTKLHVETLETP